MLSSLRSIATRRTPSMAARVMPQFLRSIASEAHRQQAPTNQDTLLDEAQAALKNLPTTTPQELPFSSINIQIPDALTSAPKTNDFMNIPPAEDPLLHFFASCIMSGGKRARANRIVSRMLLIIHARTRAPPLPIFRQAIFAISPLVKIRSDVHGTKRVEVPIPLFEKQGTRQGIMWLLKSVENRIGGFTLEERLAREIILIIKGESDVLKLRAEVHQKAMVNRGNLMLRSRRR